jgi:hypothetical protein
MVRNGDIGRVLHGVYIDSAADDTLNVRATALAKVAPEDSVICEPAEKMASRRVRR